jgi:hypothetical protein
MTEHPIIFSAPMVRAILEGRKTQTRRVLKPQRGVTISDTVSAGTVFGIAQVRAVPRDKLVGHYAVGDVLWVRETCRAEELSRPKFERPTTAKEKATLKRTTIVECPEDDGADGVRYLADNAWRKIENTPQAGNAWMDLYNYRGQGQRGIGKIVPPIHMPRWASRITLKVTGVKVERLNDISEEDAIAESASSRNNSDGDLDWSMDWGAIGKFSQYLDGPLTQRDIALGSAKWAFASYWNTLHGPGAWEANPWVAAITFEVVP